MLRAFRPALLVVACAIVLGSASPVSAQCPDWRTFAPEGLHGHGSALAVFDDGTGPALYMGGSFSSAGGVSASNVARWDGAHWSPLGAGTNALVNALCVYDDGSGPALYATGDFTQAGGVDANHIAKWDGSAWSPLGHGLRRSFVGPIPYVTGLSLAVFDDGGGPELYVGGYFLAAGDTPVRNLAKWDGTNWTPVGNGVGHGVGFVMAVFDDGSGPALFVSGGGGNSLGKWDGTSWSVPGIAPDSTVTALTVFDDGGGPALIAGGYFHNAGGVAVSGIASWDGTNWSALGPGTQGGGEVLTLASFDDGSGTALYVGGDFWGAGGLPNSASIARWDGANWSTLGSGLSGAVLDFDTYDTGAGPRLFATGTFGSSGSVQLDSIGTWSGSNWLPIGATQGFDSFVYALDSWDDGSGPALYAGGRFTASGNAVLNHVARWNGSAWLPLSSGTDSDVECLESFDAGSGTALYAGGTFTLAGGTSATFLARWNGTAWSPVGGGTNAPVYALAVFDDGSGPALYAGGQFTQAGGVAAHHIARWSGSNWSALGSGLTGSVGAFTIVRDLAVYDDGAGPALYAAGDFTSAGGVSANQIARWNGSTWAPLGSGLGGSFSWMARALCVFDDGAGPALFVGGDFTSAGSITANHVARWNGSAWSALGSGVDGGVGALAVFDDGFGPALVAGGNFAAAGAASVTKIAQWRAASWTALGAGLAGVDPSSEPHALLAFDDHAGAGVGLWVGGQFEQAGGRASYNIAEWTGCGSVSQAFCFGDGSATACPCTNTGNAGHGCANSAFASGAQLVASGNANLSADTFVLTGSGMPNSAVVYFQASAQAAGGLGVPLGDGLRCTSGAVRRLATRVNASGGSLYPAAGETPISLRGQIPAAGGTRMYQAWYRDASGPCGSGFNLTNAWRVVWAP